MYHTEQQKKEAVDGAENCVNCMSADEVEAAIKKRISGTGPSAQAMFVKRSFAIQTSAFNCYRRYVDRVS
jgi:hypothetical protein